MKMLGINIHLALIVSMFCNGLLFGQSKIYRADFFIEGEKAQDQYYKIQHKDGVWNIQERGIFLSNPNIYAFSEASIDSIGYSKVEIYFHNGNIKSHVKVERIATNFYRSYFNGELVDSIKLDSSYFLLFDGPNPSFDCFNSKFLKGREAKTITLVLINWISGTLSTEESIYIKSDTQVAVNKSETKRISFFHFSENDFLPIEYSQNKESYKFEEIDQIPDSLTEYKMKKW